MLPGGYAIIQRGTKRGGVHVPGGRLRGVKNKCFDVCCAKKSRNTCFGCGQAGSGDGKAVADKGGTRVYGGGMTAHRWRTGGGRVANNRRFVSGRPVRPPHPVCGLQRPLRVACNAPCVWLATPPACGLQRLLRVARNAPCVWGKRQRTRTGRGPDAGRTIGIKETDADRTRAWPFLPPRAWPFLPPQAW
eukprot:gene25775-biopygen3021